MDGRDNPVMTVKLLPYPFRRALFRKRLRALDIVLRRHHRLHSRIVALLGDRLLQRDRKALLDCLLGSADRHRAVLADRLGATLRRRRCFALRNHLVDEAELVAFARGDVTRGSGKAKTAFSEAMMRSQASAI